MAASAKEALEIFQKLEPDIIIGDVTMPEEDGYSLIQKIRVFERQRDKSNTPAIALTAQAGPENHNQALLVGFQAQLAKPISVIQLVDIIASFIEPR